MRPHAQGQGLNASLLGAYVQMCFDIRSCYDLFRAETTSTMQDDDYESRRTKHDCVGSLVDEINEIKTRD